MVHGVHYLTNSDRLMDVTSKKRKEEMGTLLKDACVIRLKKESYLLELEVRFVVAPAPNSLIEFLHVGLTETKVPVFVGRTPQLCWVASNRSNMGKSSGEIWIL